MNMKKMKIMWFENVALDSNYEISINGTLLAQIFCYQYLGVELDNILSHDKHLDNVVNKTTQKLYIFRKIRRFISQTTAITVYKQMILPLLKYCNILCNSGKK